MKNLTIKEQNKILKKHRTSHIHDNKDYKCRCICTCFISENAQRTGDTGRVEKESWEKRYDKLVMKFGHIEFYLEPEIEVRKFISQERKDLIEEVTKCAAQYMDLVDYENFLEDVSSLQIKNEK